ncbi:MAG: hypothetical protein ACP5GH_05205 [Nitrososphaeria archaeon]|jgi:hypothetical protein
MVSIIFTDRDRLSRINGSVIDLDGLYHRSFKDGIVLNSFDLLSLVEDLLRLAAGRSVHVFSYDTIMFMFMKRYGRRRYKLYFSNFIRSLRVLECVTGANVVLYRYMQKLRNDPGSLEDYSRPCY